MCMCAVACFPLVDDASLKTFSSKDVANETEACPGSWNNSSVTNINYDCRNWIKTNVQIMN